MRSEYKKWQDELKAGPAAIRREAIKQAILGVLFVIGGGFTLFTLLRAGW